MSIERPPPTSPARPLAAEGYVKLVARQMGLYNIINVGSEYVKVWKEQMKNTVFIKRMRSAPRPNDEDSNKIDDKIPEASSAEQSHRTKESSGKEQVVE